MSAAEPRCVCMASDHGDGSVSLSDVSGAFAHLRVYPHSRSELRGSGFVLRGLRFVDERPLYDGSTFIGGSLPRIFVIFYPVDPRDAPVRVFAGESLPLGEADDAKFPAFAPGRVRAWPSAVMVGEEAEEEEEEGEEE